MPYEVYGFDLSAPYRTVLVALEVLGQPYTLKETVTFRGDNRTEEFLKLNPQHNIPVLKDGDFVMNESRAIITYLACKHKDTKLYPDNLQTRARIHQRLDFEIGSLFQACKEVFMPVFISGIKPNQKQLDRIKENFAWFDDFVKPTGYVAGTDHMTIADLAFMTFYSTMAPMSFVDMAPYTELPKWFERVKAQIPNYERVNGIGAKKIKEMYLGKAREIGL